MTINIDKTTAELLKVFCKKNGYKINFLANQIIHKYLTDEANEKEK